MTSKEAITYLREHTKYYEPVNREAFRTIEEDLEILEEMRNDFKILDWGEGFQYRYEFIYVNRYKFFINKEQYIKWSRLLNEK